MHHRQLLTQGEALVFSFNLSKALATMIVAGHPTDRVAQSFLYHVKEEHQGKHKGIFDSLGLLVTSQISALPLKDPSHGVLCIGNLLEFIRKSRQELDEQDLLVVKGDCRDAIVSYFQKIKVPHPPGFEGLMGVIIDIAGRMPGERAI